MNHCAGKSALTEVTVGANPLDICFEAMGVDQSFTSSYELPIFCNYTQVSLRSIYNNFFFAEYFAVLTNASEVQYARANVMRSFLTKGFLEYLQEGYVLFHEHGLQEISLYRPNECGQFLSQARDHHPRLHRGRDEP
jgi:hypothetical protein